jgi:hypothetical protein
VVTDNENAGSDESPLTTQRGALEIISSCVSVGHRSILIEARPVGSREALGRIEIGEDGQTTALRSITQRSLSQPRLVTRASHGFRISKMGPWGVFRFVSRHPRIGSLLLTPSVTSRSPQPRCGRLQVLIESLAVPQMDSRSQAMGKCCFLSFIFRHLPSGVSLSVLSARRPYRYCPRRFDRDGAHLVALRGLIRSGRSRG